MTGLSWLVLKLINRPKPIGLVLLFWIAVIMGTTLLFYGLSVWFTSQA
jgi:hypothetical protein